jgi:hypothetical protein
MITTTIAFEFEGKEQSASLLKISPPPDTQFHIMVQDEELKQRFGNLFIVHYDKNKRIVNFHSISQMEIWIMQAL